MGGLHLWNGGPLDSPVWFLGKISPGSMSLRNTKSMSLKGKVDGVDSYD